MASQDLGEWVDRSALLIYYPRLRIQCYAIVNACGTFNHWIVFQLRGSCITAGIESGHSRLSGTCHEAYFKDSEDKGRRKAKKKCVSSSRCWWINSVKPWRVRKRHGNFWLFKKRFLSAKARRYHIILDTQESNIKILPDSFINAITAPPHIDVIESEDYTSICHLLTHCWLPLHSQSDIYVWYHLCQKIFTCGMGHHISLYTLFNPRTLDGFFLIRYSPNFSRVERKTFLYCEGISFTAYALGCWVK